MERFARRHAAPFAFTVSLMLIWFSGQMAFSQQVADEKAVRQSNVEPNQTKNYKNPASDEANCLTAEYPKRKYIISAGVLNAKAIELPKPEYPAKAIAKKSAVSCNSSCSE